MSKENKKSSVEDCQVKILINNLEFLERELVEIRIS